MSKHCIKCDPHQMYQNKILGGLMSFTLNKVTLVGKVGFIKEATYNGQFNLKFSVCTHRPVFIKDGSEQKVITDYHWISVWRDRALLCKKLLKVGDTVCITGEVRYTKDKNDDKKLWTEIYIPDNEKIGFLSSNHSPNQQTEEKTEELPILDGVKPYASSKSKPINPFRQKTKNDLEDDIPF